MFANEKIVGKKIYYRVIGIWNIPGFLVGTIATLRRRRRHEE
jgi:hypothetical protein